MLPPRRRRRRSPRPRGEVADGEHDDRVPHRRLPDRVGHVDEHERQRGAWRRSPRAARPPRAPQRPRQRVASRATTPSRPPIHIAATRRRARGPRAGARAPRGGAGAQGDRVRRRRQGRPHPPHGRHAGDARPGVRRLRGAGRARRRAACGRRCRGSPSCRSAAPPSAPASTPRRASPPRSSRELAGGPACRSPRRATTSRPRAPATALVELSGRCARSRSSLTKICNDLRWMGSGPRTGLGEIHLPDLQPGSSIMPGKVNPVVPEATLRCARRSIGNDATVACGRRRRQLRAQRHAAGHGAQPCWSRSRLLANGAAAARRPVRRRHRPPNVERAPRARRASPSIVTPLNRVHRVRERGEGRQARGDARG